MATVPCFPGAPPRAEGQPPRAGDVRRSFVVRFSGDGHDEEAVRESFARRGAEVAGFDIDDDGVRAYVGESSEAAVRAAAADLGASLVVPLGGLSHECESRRRSTANRSARVPERAGTLPVGQP